MSNKFKATFLVVAIVAMGGGLICTTSMPTAQQQAHNQTIRLKLQKPQKAILQLPMERATLVHPLKQHIL